MTHNDELFARAQAAMPGGVNSPVRAFGSVGGTPRFFVSARGPYVTDADGRQYVDLVASWGPAILGHAHPEVVAAVTEAASRGLSFGASTPAETELAEEIGDDAKRLEAFLVRAARLGMGIQISKTRFFTPASVCMLAAIAERVAANNADGLLTPAEFRDGSGIGRNLTIEVLEFFDKARFTRRSAAGRTVLKPASEVFGDA